MAALDDLDLLDERSKAVIAEINAAFDGVWRGNGNTLHQAAWTDKYGMRERSNEKDWSALRLQDMEHSWQEVPDEVIAENGVLSHLQPESLHYYLPAFICWTIKNYEEEWTSMASITTLSTITFRKSYAGGDIWTLERLQVFNIAQSRSLAHFLQLIAEKAEELGRTRDLRDARDGLERYWSKFLVEEPLKKRKKPPKRK
jgi:hypothetical protein